MLSPLENQHNSVPTNRTFKIKKTDCVSATNRYQTHFRAFWVSCFSSLKKAILNWCLTNSSCRKHTKQHSLITNTVSSHTQNTTWRCLALTGLTSTCWHTVWFSCGYHDELRYLISDDDDNNNNIYNNNNNNNNSLSWTKTSGFPLLRHYGKVTCSLFYNTPQMFTSYMISYVTSGWFSQSPHTVCSLIYQQQPHSGVMCSNLVRCLVQELFVWFDSTDLCVVVGLGVFVESILQPKCQRDRKQVREVFTEASWPQSPPAAGWSCTLWCSPPSDRCVAEQTGSSRRDHKRYREPTLSLKPPGLLLYKHQDHAEL